MTRQHFQLIADVLNEYEFADPEDRVNLANRFADRLRTTNPNFNRDRFIEACIL